MEFFDFRGTQFTRLTGQDGEPWWVAKEFCDYLERCPDTLGETRQVCAISEKKWHLSL
jgi:prophage antirepressor-like protein